MAGQASVRIVLSNGGGEMDSVIVAGVDPAGDYLISSAIIDLVNGAPIAAGDSIQIREV